MKLIRRKYISISEVIWLSYTWNTNRRGRLSTVELLLKLARLALKGIKVISIQSSITVQVGARRSIVLGLPPSGIIPCLGILPSYPTVGFLLKRHLHWQNLLRFRR